MSLKNLKSLILFVLPISLAQAGQDKTALVISHMADGWRSTSATFKQERQAIDGQDQAAGMLFSGQHTKNLDDALLQDTRAFYINSLDFLQTIINAGDTFDSNILAAAFSTYGDSATARVGIEDNGLFPGDKDGHDRMRALIQAAQVSLSELLPIAIRETKKGERTMEHLQNPYDAIGRRSTKTNSTILNFQRK